MEKSEKASVCIIIIIVAFSISLAAIFRNQYDEAHIDMGPMEETLWLDFPSITKSSGYYNICLAVNASTPQRIDKILINPEEVNGLNIYLNRTAVNISKSLNYQLNSGDSLQVNFTLP